MANLRSVLNTVLTKTGFVNLVSATWQRFLDSQYYHTLILRDQKHIRQLQSKIMALHVVAIIIVVGFGVLIGGLCILISVWCAWRAGWGGGREGRGFRRQPVREDRTLWGELSPSGVLVSNIGSIDLRKALPKRSRLPRKTEHRESLSNPLVSKQRAPRSNAAGLWGEGELFTAPTTIPPVSMNLPQRKPPGNDGTQVCWELSRQCMISY